MPSLLNIGAGHVQIPQEYRHYHVVTLDLDAQTEPDLCMDVRNLRDLAPRQYDVVYASHILEHLSAHEVDGVLWGIWWVLADSGHAYVRVPDVLGVIAHVAAHGLDLDSLLYQSAAGPIHVSDVLWGWREAIQNGGGTFYQHKTGFSRNTLGRALRAARFEYVEIGKSRFELHAHAWKRRPEGK